MAIVEPPCKSGQGEGDQAEPVVVNSEVDQHTTNSNQSGEENHDQQEASPNAGTTVADLAADFANNDQENVTSDNSQENASQEGAVQANESSNEVDTNQLGRTPQPIAENGAEENQSTHAEENNNQTESTDNVVVMPTPASRTPTPASRSASGYNMMPIVALVIT